MSEYIINKTILDKIIVSLKKEYHYKGNINNKNISKLKFFKIKDTLFLRITYNISDSKNKELYFKFIGDCSIKYIINQFLILLYFPGQSSPNMLINQDLKNNNEHKTYLEKLFFNLLNQQQESLN